MANPSEIDYMTPLSAYEGVPAEYQEATSSPTPREYTRDAAKAIPICILPAPPVNEVEVAEAFREATLGAETVLSKLQLAQIMSLGFMIQVSGDPVTLMQGVAEGSFLEAMTMPDIKTRQDSRITAAIAAMALDPAEEGADDMDDRAQQADAESALSKARAMVYICLSLMRLAVKPAESFMKGIHQLKQAYSVLVGEHSEFLFNYSYSEGMCRNIADMFNQCDDLKATLCHHCAIADETHHSNRKRHGLLRFLILQHVDLTGMIPYGMYIDMRRHFTLLTPGQLLTWLHDNQVSRPLSVIADINTRYDVSNGADRFWRYSRGLDPGFFIALQQSKCVTLIARMAHILVKGGAVAVNEYSDPRKAKSLENKPGLAAEADKFATEFVEAYNGLSGSSANAGPVSRKLYNQGRGIPTRRGLFTPPSARPAPVVNVHVPAPSSSLAGALDAMNNE